MEHQDHPVPYLCRTGSAKVISNNDNDMNMDIDIDLSKA